MGSFYLLIIIIVTIVLEAYFAGSETAVVSCSKLRLRYKAKKGSRAAMKVESFLRRPEQFFSTVLVGTNISVIICTASATALAVRLFDHSGALISTVVMTPVLLVFGEVIPKSIFLYHADKIAIIVAPVLDFFYYILWPIVFPANLLVHAFLKVSRAAEWKTNLLSSREELVYLYSVGKANGALERRERIIMDRIFSFESVKLRDVMIPADRVVSFPVNSTVDEVVEKANKYSYYRFPITTPDGSRVVGVVSLFDLLGLDGGEKLSSVMHQPKFVSSDDSAERVFLDMKGQSIHMAVVTDEDGAYIGIVTLENILESIVGRIYSEYEK
ncbi:MAG: hypothetical protein B6D63_03025 [Candidatus Latescibacteria bacterium 4484_7]|nr:MAG: hypothetical protein B6D63_03025 [Candidatus Latescibacteria bacterium 4484_7]